MSYLQPMYSGDSTASSPHSHSQDSQLCLVPGKSSSRHRGASAIRGRRGGASSGYTSQASSLGAGPVVTFSVPCENLPSPPPPPSSGRIPKPEDPDSPVVHMAREESPQVVSQEEPQGGPPEIHDPSNTVNSNNVVKVKQSVENQGNDTERIVSMSPSRAKPSRCNGGLRSHRSSSRHRIKSASILTSRKSGESLEAKSDKEKEKEKPRQRLFYVVQFGNHSSQIRQLMIPRPGWTPGPGDPGHSAGKCNYEEHRVKVNPSDDLPDIHFLWSQYQVKAFLDAMHEQQAGWVVTVNEEAKFQMKQKKDSSSQAANPQEAPPPATPPVRVHNHFEGNVILSNKAGLRQTIVSWYLSHGRDPFGAIPLTFVIRQGTEDEEYAEWLRTYNEISETHGQQVWLIKPGERANQGRGISICDSAEEVAEKIEADHRVWVVQKYMEMPLLIHKRKFDIRSYCLVTQDPNDKSMKGYFYKEAYLRTTSAEYSLKSKDRLVHLNNDAVQKHGEAYGKFESANKMSLTEFQRYLDQHHPEYGLSVEGTVVPQMRNLMADTIKAAGERLNPRNIDYCFEVFGFDFMVDASGRVWLIEVNTNPCLTHCNALLARLIPKMLDQALQLSLDQIFPQGALPADKKGNTANGWEEIYCSTSASAKQLSCDWLPVLPDAKGSEPDSASLASLGRDLVKTKPLAPPSKPSTASTGPKSPRRKKQ
eukprot:TRINITY_DN48498_c0_g1_i1.p1 TRINITY_DN48498_c0_g1~~TRINITY_DN48498_c0_g1_i1.p1  ORF type:complete len:775 (-),score=100.73 TRINITY_DN48498_c0_g1_i1:113-2227(-)